MARTTDDALKYLSLTGLKQYDGKVKEWVDDKVTKEDIRLEGLINSEAGTRESEDARLEGLINGISTNVSALKTFTVNDQVYDPKGNTNVDIDFTLEHDETAKEIRLVVTNGGTKTTVGTVETDKFVKDGMLQSVDLITIPNDDEAATDARPAGKYLKLTWNIDSGIDVTYLNVSELIDVYKVEAGEGVSGTYINLGIKVTGTGSVNDPWKISPTLEETKLVNKFTAVDGRLDTLETFKNTTYLADKKALQDEDSRLAGLIQTNTDKFAGYYTKTEVDNLQSAQDTALANWKTNTYEVKVAALEAKDSELEGKINNITNVELPKYKLVSEFNDFITNDYNSVKATVTKLDGDVNTAGSVLNLINAEKERSEARYIHAEDEITATEINQLFMAQVEPTTV